MKKIVLSLFCLALVSGNASAATVAISRSGVGVVALTSTGTLLSTGGYYIGVGSFDAVPTVTDAASLTAAVAAFQEFGATTSPISGGTIGTITGSVTSTNSLFNSKEIFIVVGNSASKAASTEFAIIRGTPTWSFISNVAQADNISVVIQNLNSFSPIAGDEVDVAATQDQLRLMSTVPIPEPGVSLLALASLGLLARRRRN